MLGCYIGSIKPFSVVNYSHCKLHKLWCRTGDKASSRSPLTGYVKSLDFDQPAFVKKSCVSPLTVAGSVMLIMVHALVHVPTGGEG